MDASAVITQLVQNYGANSVRPGLAAGGSGEAERVVAQLHVERWHDLDQRALTFGLDGYLRLWWRDQRLAYNASDAGTDALQLGLRHVAHHHLDEWVPLQLLGMDGLIV